MRCATSGAIKLRKAIDHEWLLILSGLVSVAFGVEARALALAWVIAAYAVVFGILLTGLSFRLKKHAFKNPTTTLTRFAWLSIGAAALTIGLKFAAYLVTGSVGILSDALESLVNLAAALMALAMLTVASRAPDEMHAFGYGKAEYFSSGVEGALILLAAASIIWTALPRLSSPQPLKQVGIGVAVSVIASAINFGVARRLLRAGKAYRSIALEAGAHHLITDVWTSAGIITGILAVHFTGWHRLDPIIAIVVAANIVRIGAQLLRRSVLGLLDRALPAAEQDAIKEVLSRYDRRDIHFHALRTRRAGARSFFSMHVLVPGNWTVQRGHDALEEIERDVRTAVPGSSVFTHWEPRDDPAAWQDNELEPDADAKRS